MTNPIEQDFREQMNELARLLDQYFNGTAKGEDRKVCFTLLVGNFGDVGRCNYISNGQRQDIIVMMKELIARFEGQPFVKGRA